MSVYKDFRSVNTIPLLNEINKRYDEPTYFSFRLIFGSNGDKTYNDATDSASFDVMPHPLFNTSNIEELKKSSNIIDNKTDPLLYSSVQYLYDSNEPIRAKMLIDFINKFNIIQEKYPYYFQSIEGVGELLKIDTTKGRRIVDKKLTITCLESVDLKMSYLLNLYRKIVWDDVWQRWVLPDMMRYFTLDIYLTEYRTFHSWNNVTNYETKNMTLKILNDTFPIWKIKCEMCEFNLSDISFSELESLNVGSEPTQATVKFSINVGNVKETQIYPLFKHKYLVDRKLNGIDRTNESISLTEEKPSDITTIKDMQNIAQNIDTQEEEHTSGLPYNENANNTTFYGAKIGNVFESENKPIEVKPTEPATWVSNALSFGKSYVKNEVHQIIDKSKMMNIPLLGVSFNEIQLMLQAKNVVGALGLIRKGVDEYSRQFGNAPSEKLNGPISTDSMLKEVLVKLSKSKATDEETKLLVAGATLALNDKGMWEKIKDYSLATNLVSSNEENVEKSLNNADEYSEIVNKQSKIKKDNIETAQIPIILPNAVSGKIESEKLYNESPSSKLNNNIKNNLSQIPPSSKLSTNIESDKLYQGTSSNKLNDQIEIVETEKAVPSEKLKGEISSSLLQDKSNIRKKTIELSNIIEYSPTSVINKKIEDEKLKQPEPSKATNSKIEK